MPEKQQPQTDPWAEAAKNFHAQPRAETAPQGGNDDWKVWQQNDEPQTDSRNGFQRMVDTAAESEPVTGVGSVLNNLGAGATRAVMSPIAHPISTLEGLGDIALSPFSRSAAERVNRNLHGMAAQFKDKPLGESIATLPSVALAAAGGGEAGSPSMVSPEEAQSLRIAKAVQPPVMRTYRENLQRVLPEVQNFAKEGGVSKMTQPEFGKAAEGAANRVWKEEYNPLRDKAVQSPPETFGRLPGELNIPGGMSGPGGTFHYGTIPKIEQRLAEINKLLKPAYNVRNEGQEMTSLERAAELNREAGGLRHVLYEDLGRANNMQPDAIKAIRERGGALESLGQDTKQAIEDRARGVGRSEEGQPIPLNKLGMIDHVATWLRGGREAVADANLRRALRSGPSVPAQMAQGGAQASRVMAPASSIRQRNQ